MWTGAKNTGGYGMLSVKNRMVTASRVSYETFIGPIPEGKYVCHTCDQPACIRPEHLFVGSARDNSADRDSKGRGRNGKEGRTACPNGHPYTPENTLTQPGARGPVRKCKPCTRATQRRYKARQRKG